LFQESPNKATLHHWHDVKENTFPTLKLLPNITVVSQEHGNMVIAEWEMLGSGNGPIAVFVLRQICFAQA